MTHTIPPARTNCPKCGKTSDIVLMELPDDKSSIVSACCEALIPHLNEDAPVLIVDGHLVCPYGDCGAVGEIVELDVATRDNELSIDPDQPGVIKASLGDHSFEADGYECRKCTRSVTIPNGYEIERD
ncbi:hypothetical protein [Microbispora sp. NBRC 16548]|uniref:hypothetical protein n=1 Tax=Microbispora sp. NBRC 16548 TaxID=3030994 RepID=UPI0024A4EFF9|nr:hypothetical protein [Microbispora sp. NBRC 16548]GLX06682.1 hypothetical protein Misp03_36090 [Microbispora sp. NBRC 16548]